MIYNVTVKSPDNTRNVTNTSAESLLEAIDSFILQKGLPANKLYYLRSDGASNMTGLCLIKNYFINY